jgi:hypothetical protein
MNAEELAEHLHMLRELTAEVDTESTSEALLATAERLSADLTPKQHKIAATFYLLRLLKDRHREAVVTVERTAMRQASPRKVTRTPEEQANWERSEQEHRERMAEIDRRYFDEMKRITDKFANALKVQWTKELLASTFALPDGTLVAWGQATLEQHSIRRDMLLSNAKGNLQAASRHEAAIAAIQEQGVTCLRDVSQSPATTPVNGCQEWADEGREVQEVCPHCEHYALHHMFDGCHKCQDLV